MLRTKPARRFALTTWLHRLWATRVAWSYSRVCSFLQMFMSAGVVIKSSKCSICDALYEDCEHIKGKVYMGRFCGRMITDVAEIKEVSVVEDPADKRARVLVIGDGTTERDYMTWRVIETDRQLGEAEGSTA